MGDDRTHPEDMEARGPGLQYGVQHTRRYGLEVVRYRIGRYDLTILDIKQSIRKYIYIR